LGSSSEKIAGSSPAEGFGLYGGMANTLVVVKSFSNLRGIKKSSVVGGAPQLKKLTNWKRST
jgi:hypothetical protein